MGKKSDLREQLLVEIFINISSRLCWTNMPLPPSLSANYANFSAPNHFINFKFPILCSWSFCSKYLSQSWFVNVPIFLIRNSVSFSQAWCFHNPQTMCTFRRQKSASRTLHDTWVRSWPGFCFNYGSGCHIWITVAV